MRGNFYVRASRKLRMRLARQKPRKARNTRKQIEDEDDDPMAINLELPLDHSRAPGQSRTEDNQQNQIATVHNSGTDGLIKRDRD